MKREDKAQLKMRRPLCVSELTDEKEYIGHVLKYDEEKECLFLTMDIQDIGVLSLDALYECEIQSEDTLTKCVGIIEERYCGKWGMTIKLVIKNGFYKINIK